MAKMNRAKSLEKYQTRQWREGDIYSPHDLSPAEMKKWTQPKGKTEDVFDILGINPIHEYKVSYEKFSFFHTPLGMARIGRHGDQD